MRRDKQEHLMIFQAEENNGNSLFCCYKTLASQSSHLCQSLNLIYSLLCTLWIAQTKKFSLEKSSSDLRLTICWTSQLSYYYDCTWCRLWMSWGNSARKLGFQSPMWSWFAQVVRCYCSFAMNVALPFEGDSLGFRITFAWLETVGTSFGVFPRNSTF